MAYNIFKELELREPKPTRMNIQWADRTMKNPREIIEYILVKVDEFIFSINFEIMDLDGDVDVPLIFGRPFLATSQAIIEFKDGC